MSRRRFFRYGELPLVLLALLDTEARGGYELMSELERLYGPAYRPSPGSVYPALKALAAEHLVVADDEGAATTYRPTAAGCAVLAERRDELAGIEHRTGRRLLADDAVDAALARLRSRVVELASRVPAETIVDELDAAGDRIDQAASVGTVKGRPR